MTNNPYERWLEKRRDVTPPSALADQIMSDVIQLERRQREIWWLQIVQQIERSRVARWAVYGGALAVGSLPFVFFVRVAPL